MKGWPLAAAFLIPVQPAQAQEPDLQRDSLIARAKSLELSTPYVPPPGDPLVHHAAGFAKIMCSAVFVTGLQPDFAAENVGYFTAPLAQRAKMGKPAVDRARKTVQVKLPGGTQRTAFFLGDQGCVTLPIGKQAVSFIPNGASASRAGHSEGASGCGCRVRAVRSDDRRLRRDVEGADRRRAIRPGRHSAYSA